MVELIMVCDHLSKLSWLAALEPDAQYALLLQTHFGWEIIRDMYSYCWNLPTAPSTFIDKQSHWAGATCNLTGG